MKKGIGKRIKELEDKIDTLSSQLNFAVNYMENDPAGSLNKSRIVLEKVLFNVFVAEMETEPKRTESGFILNNNQFTRKIDARIVARMKSVKDMGNLGTHGEPVLNEADALRVLTDLCDILEWYIENYANHLSVAESESVKKPQKKLKNKRKLLLAFVLLAIPLSILLPSYFYAYKNMYQHTPDDNKIENSKSESLQKAHQANIESVPVINESNDVPEQQWEDFNFKLSSCFKDGEKVQCKMIVSSVKKDAVLAIHRKSAIFDDNGNKENIKNIQYGNNFNYAMKHHRHLFKEFIADVPVQAIFTFNLPDKQSSKIAALKLKFGRVSSYRIFGEIIFRDIPL